MQVRARRVIFFLLAMALALNLLPQAEPASAATINVDSTADAVDATSLMTLRYLSTLQEEDSLRTQQDVEFD